jgi:hypothetical protein
MPDPSMQTHYPGCASAHGHETAGEDGPDSCRPVTLPDGEVVRVRGGEEPSDEAVRALAAITAAARQRMAEDHANDPPVLAQVADAVETRAAAEDLLLRTAAKQAGVSPAVLSRVRQGGADTVTVGDLVALARWAGLEISSQPASDLKSRTGISRQPTSEPAGPLGVPVEPPTLLVGDEGRRQAALAICLHHDTWIEEQPCRYHLSVVDVVARRLVPAVAAAERTRLASMPVAFPAVADRGGHRTGAGLRRTGGPPHRPRQCR